VKSENFGKKVGWVDDLYAVLFAFEHDKLIGSGSEKSFRARFYFLDFTPLSLHG